VTVRVRFADLRAITRSITLEAPISATATIADIAVDLVRLALAQHRDEKFISLVAVSLSHLQRQVEMQLDLPLGLADERRRPGARMGMARSGADRAIDAIRQRFGWGAVGYGSAILEISRSVPDGFRELAEKEL
jgi:DNA polymerase-4